MVTNARVVALLSSLALFGLAHAQPSVSETFVVHLDEGGSLTDTYIVAPTATVIPAINDAGDLCASLPGATSVESFDGVANQWDLFACTGTCPSLACFTVVAGEAYRVTLGGPGKWFFNGVDPAVALTLSDPNGHAVALPWRTTLLTASDVRDSINTISPNSVLAVSAYITQSDALQTYAGISGANDFALRPGHGIQIVTNTSVNWTPPVASPTSRSYRIAGTGDATDFDWEIFDGLTSLCSATAVNFTVSANPATMAMELAQSMGGVPACATAGVTATAIGDTLQIALPAGASPRLEVDTPSGGGSPCTVTSSGCTINPTITLIETMPIPDLPPLGVMLMIAAMAAAGFWMIRRGL